MNKPGEVIRVLLAGDCLVFCAGKVPGWIVIGRASGLLRPGWSKPFLLTPGFLL